MTLRRIETACNAGIVVGLVSMFASIPVAVVTTGEKTVTDYSQKTTAQGKPIGPVTAQNRTVNTGDATGAWVTLGSGTLLVFGSLGGSITAQRKRERTEKENAGNTVV